jgi:hypothetical protein
MDHIYNQGALGGFVAGLFVMLMVGGIAAIVTYQARLWPFSNLKEKD